MEILEVGGNGYVLYVLLLLLAVASFCCCCHHQPNFCACMLQLGGTAATLVVAHGSSRLCPPPIRLHGLERIWQLGNKKLRSPLTISQMSLSVCAKQTYRISVLTIPLHKVRLCSDFVPCMLRPGTKSEEFTWKGGQSPKGYRLCHFFTSDVCRQRLKKCDT